MRWGSSPPRNSPAKWRDRQGYAQGSRQGCAHPEGPTSCPSRREMLGSELRHRFVKPAARKVALPFVNWRCLRTSHATWLVQAGADPKSVQGQMRHSRISTTMDIYAQIVPAAQRRAIEKLSEFANASRPKPVTLLSQ